VALTDSLIRVQRRNGKVPGRTVLRRASQTGGNQSSGMIARGDGANCGWAGARGLAKSGLRCETETGSEMAEYSRSRRALRFEISRATRGTRKVSLRSSTKYHPAAERMSWSI